MSDQVCVNCDNKKPVNSTSNRLVTESCGHVKCMGCLLQEQSGCVACSRESDTEKALDLLEIEIGEAQEDASAKPSEVTTKASPETKKKKPENKHIILINNGEEKYYLCTVCNKRFHSRSHVAYHSYCNGQSKPFQCPECNKGFASQSHFTYHMRVHRNERMYSCETCGESFFQMCKLQRHRTVQHTKEKNHSCEICNKAFNNYSALRKHCLIHTEERPYKCEACGARFRDSSNYKKHMFKHDDTVSKCSCAVCGREVGSQRSLQSHAKHHQRRAFQCPRCPHAFHSKKDLRRHIAVHSDSKPFRCKVCTRCFRRKDNLERHIRSKHPDFVPAAAVECDESALTEQLTTANDNITPAEERDLAEEKEKTMLQMMNPLPPLTKEVIQQMTDVKTSTTFIDNTPSPSPTDLSIKTDEKSFILEANIARQSVIFGPIAKKESAEKNLTIENVYVHKIRKANLLAKDSPLPPMDEDKVRMLLQSPLPPMDEEKMRRVVQETSADVGVPTKNEEVIKKIFYENEREQKSGKEDAGNQGDNRPEMHWRRKMKLNINTATISMEDQPQAPISASGGPSTTSADLSDRKSC